MIWGRYQFVVALVSAAGLSIVISTHSAEGSWILLEDFEDVTVGANLGAVNPGENFYLNVGDVASSATVQISPWDSLNRAARLDGTRVQLFMPALIAQGTTATLFYQLYRPNSAVNLSVGMSDDNYTAITSWSNFNYYESQLAINQVGSPQVFRVRDGSAFRTSTTGFEATTLYNVWQVINNSTDRSEIYVQRDGIDPAPIKIVEGSIDSFGFRNGTASNDLVTFLAMTSSGSGSVSTHTTAWLDNIYLSTGENLTNPVPEPATGILALLALVATVGWTRRAMRRSE